MKKHRSLHSIDTYLGGVGKSTFSAQLTFALAAAERSVGLLDIDICGPSIPKILGVEVREITHSTDSLDR